MNLITKIQYTTEEERQSIMNSNSGLILVETQNLFEGNFLVFSDTPPEEKIVYTNVPQVEFDSLQQQNAQIILALVEGGLM
jgi:hypothetical protein